MSSGRTSLSRARALTRGEKLGGGGLFKNSDNTPNRWPRRRLRKCLGEREASLRRDHARPRPRRPRDRPTKDFTSRGLAMLGALAGALADGPPSREDDGVQPGRRDACHSCRVGACPRRPGPPTAVAIVRRRRGSGRAKVRKMTEGRGFFFLPLSTPKPFLELQSRPPFTRPSSPSAIFDPARQSQDKRAVLCVGNKRRWET